MDVASALIEKETAALAGPVRRMTTSLGKGSLPGQRSGTGDGDSRGFNSNDRLVYAGAEHSLDGRP